VKVTLDEHSLKVINTCLPGIKDEINRAVIQYSMFDGVYEGLVDPLSSFDSAF